jgi:glutathione synthase/RimK-type ligase-like ATP-grasp enzyme
MNIGIATSEAELPKSDQSLVASLADHKLRVRPVIWSSAGLEWREFDLVVIRSCWDYHLRSNEFFSWIGSLEDQGVLVLNPPPLLRWNANKVYLAELAAAGIAIPETLFIEPSQEVDLGQVCRSRGWRKAVVKPTISASAWRTELRRSGVVCGPVMVQEYIEAIETEGEWSLVYISGEFSHAVVKKPGAGDFRVQANLGGTVTAINPPREIRGFAEAVLRRLNWPAIFARIDIVASGIALFLMEVEVIEPELFLDLAPGSSQALASAIRNFLLQVPWSSSPAMDASA